MTLTEEKLNQIEKRLKEVDLPKEIRLDPGSLITNVPNFFKSHILMLRTCKNEEHIKLYEDRFMIAAQAVKIFNENK